MQTNRHTVATCVIDFDGVSLKADRTTVQSGLCGRVVGAR